MEGLARHAIHPAQGVAIAVGAAGNVYALGSMATQDGGLEFATAKYNTNGVRQWVDYYFRPDNGQNIPSKIAVSGAGNAYVAGTSSFENTTGLASAVAIKYDSNGAQAWTRAVDNFNAIGSVNIAVDTQENVYWAVTEVLVTGTDNRSYIYEYNANGVLLSTTAAGGFSNAIQTDAQGNSYIAGSTPTIPAENAQPMMAEFKAAGGGWQDVITTGGPFAGNSASRQTQTEVYSYRPCPEVLD